MSLSEKRLFLLDMDGTLYLDDRLCADFPSVRRHFDPLRHGALLHRLLRHPPQHERRCRYAHFRSARLSDAEIRSEYGGGRPGIDSRPNQRIGRLSSRWRAASLRCASLSSLEMVALTST